MHPPKANRNRYYYYTIGLGLLAVFFIQWFQQDPDRVEQYYSRGFYPLFAHLPKLLFAWLPFSFGDIFYGLLVLLISYLGFRFVVRLLRGNWSAAWFTCLRLLSLLLGAYVYFYLSWGLNYYRQPLSQQLSLQVDTLSQAQHLRVLDAFILQANTLGEQLGGKDLDRHPVTADLESFMLKDTLLKDILSKSYVQGKAPLSSTLISYFTVTGYFNPFTQEVQVNQNMPAISYPFTTVHELAHQMGIGFEDECNFIAFLKLHQHPNPWYRYAAYYETVQYLLRPLYGDKELYTAYFAKLSPLVVEDVRKDQVFWQSYQTWFNSLTDWFYTGFLKHNNQPEGMARYDMMSRLVIAWELKKEQALKPSDSSSHAPL